MTNLNNESTSSIYRCRNLARVEVGIGKDRLDTLLNPVVWRQIGHVSIISQACTAGEDADNASLAVSDDGPRIPGGGESVVLVTVRVGGNHHGCRVNALVIIFPDEGFDAGTATDGDSGAVTILDNDNTLFAPRVERGWAGQLIFLNDVPKREEIITWIFGGVGPGVSIHLCRILN